MINTKSKSWIDRKLPVWASVFSVFVLACVALACADYTHDFARLWDFRVYLKAKEHLALTGTPYYESESLRFIYPPTSIFLLHVISSEEWFKSAYFVVAGALWLSTATIFCRRPVHYLIVFPVLFLAFGKHGYITLLTGNIACVLYFIAAASAWMHFTGRMSAFFFAALILGLTLIKPFYAEFLIFIWFTRGLRDFLITSVAVVALFFAINLLIYPDLFSEFLSALKLDRHDSEIFGITLMSHLGKLGFPTLIAAGLHFLLIGGLFLAFLGNLTNMSNLERFCCLFILAVFINPKHITYDLLVALPALTVLLLETRPMARILGFALILISSTLDFGIAGEAYFQWWYGFVFAFAIVLFVGKPLWKPDELIRLINNPSSGNHTNIT
ncbi:MAG: hypothetical protein AAF423_07505 [Pseudomonadota bacterium]